MLTVREQLMVSLHRAMESLEKELAGAELFASDEHYDVLCKSMRLFNKMVNCLRSASPTSGRAARWLGTYAKEFNEASQKLCDLVQENPSLVPLRVMLVFSLLADDLQTVRDEYAWRDSDPVTKTILFAFSLVDFADTPVSMSRLLGLLLAESRRLNAYLDYLISTARTDVRKDVEMIRTDWLDLSGALVISQEVTIDKVWQRVAELLRAVQ